MLVSYRREVKVEKMTEYEVEGDVESEVGRLKQNSKIQLDELSELFIDIGWIRFGESTLGLAAVLTGSKLPSRYFP